MAAGLLPSRRHELSKHRVSAAAFVELLTSRRRLTRLDDGANRLRGLVDGLGNWYTTDAGLLTHGASRLADSDRVGSIANRTLGTGPTAGDGGPEL